MYTILYFFLYLVSLLPFRILYWLADFLYFVLFTIFGYRKEVVLNNLKTSFPEKSQQEITEISKRYYRNLCDNIVETIKLISISKSELDKRMICNWEVFESMTSQNRNGQAFMSHQFNWEWATVICNWHSPRRFTGIYMPLTNKAFDKLMFTIRSRANMKLIRVHDMQKEMASLQNQETLWGLSPIKTQVTLNEFHGTILCIEKQHF
ncbi:MAG: hypothetical protein IPI46_03410 [Bacteroidetes bacterium]|nr:hypothetical protein [Bacteroidota bacterium]